MGIGSFFKKALNVVKRYALPIGIAAASIFGFGAFAPLLAKVPFLTKALTAVKGTKIFKLAAPLMKRFIPNPLSLQSRPGAGLVGALLNQIPNTSGLARFAAMATAALGVGAAGSDNLVSLFAAQHGSILGTPPFNPSSNQSP